MRTYLFVMLFINKLFNSIQFNEWMDGWMDIWKGGWVDIWTDGWIDYQYILVI